MEEILHASNILLFLRLANVILITLTVTAWLIFYKRYKLIMAIAPVGWLFHVLIYGVYRFVYTPFYGYITERKEVNMDIWTAIVIMHGIILLLVAAIESIPVYPPREKGKECKK